MSLSRERNLASTSSSILSRRLNELILLVLRSEIGVKITLSLFFEDILNKWRLGQLDFIFLDISQDDINLINDFFTSLD